MIDPVSSFSISSVELVDNQTKIVCTFTKPVGNIGGYHLYMSSTGIIYTKVKTRIDASRPQTSYDTTYDVSGTTYFEYTLPDDSTDGKLLYFKLQSISTTRELSIFSDVETTYTYPSKPEDLFILYDGIGVYLSWDELDFSDDKNATFLNYNIYRSIALPIEGVSSYDDETSIISNDNFEVGNIVLVTDIFKRSRWFGEVTTVGKFDLTTTKISGYSDNSSSYSINIDNLKIYTTEPPSTLIGVSDVGSFQDTTFGFNHNYVYSVKSIALGIRESSSAYYHCISTDTTESYPYLRPVENSSTGLLNNPYWRTLKNVLIDKSYYDKTAFAIPYAVNTSFNLKGFLGVSECKLDIFINDIYSYTTSTGQYGEFNIDFVFPKGTTTMSFQARDKHNIKFSRKSAPYSIRTLNIYTWFSSVLGTQYSLMETELNNQVTLDASIEDCRYSYFEDRYSPFIGLYKNGDEDEQKFRNIAAEVFKAFEYSSYDKSLRMVLDSFNENAIEFDHYDIYYNESLYETKKTMYSFVATSSGLTRGNYWYGVSACKNTGEETAVTKLRVDRRWWPTGYMRMNTLMWDFSEDADCYKIYRGTTESDLYFLTSSGINVFIDVDQYEENLDIEALDYNLTDLIEPANLYLYDKNGVNKLFLKLKKPNSLAIILYGVENNELTEYDITRIMDLLEKLIPPELKYRVIFANNSKVIMYPEGTDVTIPTSE